jgi:drug/metabolite transporter (DMT)-like permease
VGRLSVACDVSRDVSSAKGAVMALFALGCILIAALLHATWNFLAKRVQGGAPFSWLCDICGVLLLAPVVLGFAAVSRPTLSTEAIGAICISGMLQAGYIWFLQRGYQVGDFSVVYPLARGSGAGIVVLGSVLLLGEPITIPNALGAACMVLGIVLITSRGQHTSAHSPRGALLYGLLTGLCIAGYTLWDRTAMTRIGIAPLLLYWGALAVRACAQTPIAIRHWPRVQLYWSLYRREAIGVALLSATSYLLILTVLLSTTASIVAPAREISILFGTLMGHRLLVEGQALPRSIGASLLVLGIGVLAFGLLS